jgi:hypothetical protein
LLAFDEIELDKPLLVSPGDFLLATQARPIISKVFEEGTLDAFALTMTSQDPRLSYSRVDADGRILEYCEKNVVSDVATSGVFGFRRAGEFLESAKWVLEKNINLADRFYVSASVNYFIMSGKRVGNVHIGSDSQVFQKNWGSK